MKRSLLDIVQNILFALDSDPVNTISDTVEAMQVAEVVRDTYFEMVDNRYWPQNQGLLSFNASTDASLPTVMTLADNVDSITWLRYDKSKSPDPDRYEEVIYREPEDFYNATMQYDLKNTDKVFSYELNGRRMYGMKDIHPTYYTSFDDRTLIFDSYDSEEDSTVQNSKITAMGYIKPTFDLTENFVPDIPDKAFIYLLSESKSVAFNQIKQAANQKEEQRSRRQRIWLAREKFIVNGGIKFPQDYGRK